MRRALGLGAGLGLALLVATCTDQTITGPARPGIVALNLGAWAAFQAGGPPIPVEQIRVTLRRADQSLALDTTISFRLDTLQADSIVLRLSVPLRQSPEDFDLTVLASGQNVDWFRATGRVRLTAGVMDPTNLVATYVGPGFNADSVRLRLPTTQFVAGATVPLQADVYGPGGTRLSGVPVGYRLSNTSLGTIAFATPFSATFTAAQGVRLSGYLVVETPTRLRDSLLIDVVRVAATGDTLPIVVSQPQLFLSLDPTVGVGQRFTGFVSLPIAVAADLVVTLTNSNPAALTLPATVTIPQFGSFVQFTAVGVAPGLASVQATATGFTPSVPDTTVVTTPRLDVSTTTFGYFGQGSVNFDVFVEDSTFLIQEVNAPLTVTLALTNTRSATLGSTTMTIPVGGFFGTASWQPLAADTSVGVDTFRVVASASGYPPDTSFLISVLTPDLFLSLGSTVGIGQRLSGTVFLPFAVATALSVTLTDTSTAALMQPLPAVTIPAGSSFANFTLVGGAAGRALVVVAAAGFTPDTVPLDVGTPQLFISGPAFGTAGGTGNLSVQTLDQVGFARPVDTDLTVTFSVNNTAVADFGGGVASVNQVIPAGSSFASRTLNFTGPGTVQVTVSATGYTPDTIPTVTVTVPQLFLSLGSTVGIGQQLSGSVSLPIAVASALAVTLTGTPAGVLTLPAVTIPAGSSFASFTAVGVAAGSTNVQATATGFNPSSSVTTTVSVGQITLSLGTTVGIGQRNPGFVSVGFALASSLVITLTNSNPTALTLPAVTIPVGSSFASFTAVGAAAGSTNVQATATGFTSSSSVTTTVGTPQLFLSGSTTGLVGSTGSIFVQTLDQAGAGRAVDQAVTVTLTVSNTAVANFAGQASVTQVIPAGGSFASAIINFVAAGNVSVIATATGFVSGQLNARVSGP